jgi:hypothetical protein
MNDYERSVDDDFDFDTEEYSYDTDPYTQEYISNRLLAEEAEYNPYDF